MKNIRDNRLLVIVTDIVELNSRSMDAHEQETKQQESCEKRTAEITTHRNSEDGDASITAVENHPKSHQSIALYKVRK